MAWAGVHGAGPECVLARGGAARAETAHLPRQLGSRLGAVWSQAEEDYVLVPSRTLEKALHRALMKYPDAI